MQDSNIPSVRFIQRRRDAVDARLFICYDQGQWAKIRHVIATWLRALRRSRHTPGRTRLDEYACEG
eukprot:750180-Hanusia_phi.AAC.13